jgi:hypothetical protein
MTMEKRMSRKKKLLLWVLGSVVTVAGGLLLVLALLPRSEFDLPVDVEHRQIPSSWMQTAPGEPSDDADGSMETDDGTAADDSAAQDTPTAPTADPSDHKNAPALSEASPGADAHSVGLLAMFSASGEQFGAEAYELESSDGSVILHSTGELSFKVAVVSARVTYEQTVTADSELCPVSYVAEYNAPWGYAPNIRATVDGARVLIESGEQTHETSIEDKRAFILGTFGSYVLLPHLYARWSANGTAAFDVFVLGGMTSRASRDSRGGGSASRQSQSSLGSAKAEPMTIRRMGTATIRTGEILFDADYYIVSGPNGGGELFSRGGEFLGFRSPRDQGYMWIYRLDYFPDGIEVVGGRPDPEEEGS